MQSSAEMTLLKRSVQIHSDEAVATAAAAAAAAPIDNGTLQHM
jgi:hypothetical protein